jgi:hypothetical protein
MRARENNVSYYRYLNGDAKITGGDVSDELLSQARRENKKINNAL